MVERVNQGVRLGEYMKKHIWSPLGMDSTTFHSNMSESIRNRLCPMTARTDSGALVPSQRLPSIDPKDDFGGEGVYCSPNDYMKLLISILKNDGRVLKSETVNSMFQPQLSDASYLRAKTNGQAGAIWRGGVPGEAWNYGLGGLLAMEDIEGVCKKGTMSWIGFSNLYWVSCVGTALINKTKANVDRFSIPKWIDPRAGTCGFYASQLIPPGDPISMELAVAFRKDVHVKLIAADRPA